MEDALLKGCVAAQIAEALANYVRADELLVKSARAKRRFDVAGECFISDDRQFWRRASQTEPPAAVSFHGAALTEWVARVPGLFWHAASAQTRAVDPARILFRTNRHVTYEPRGKSQMVSGGIGTLRFPPAEDGYRLVTLSPSHNASSGIPALVSPEVWRGLRLSEGSVLRVDQAECRDMPLKWAERFPIVSGIRRVCVVLDDCEAIDVLDQNAPVEVHPFSVMEYQDGDAQMHDFVFVTADTSEKGFRDDVSTFFGDYRKDRGREGTYLTSADIASPMWEAMFDDPADMRLHKGTQLRLIERRVEEAAKGQDVIDALIRKLSSVSGPNDLKHLSGKVDIDYRRWWIEGSSLANAVQRFVDFAIKSEKQLSLLHVMQLELR